MISPGAVIPLTVISQTPLRRGEKAGSLVGFSFSSLRTNSFNKVLDLTPFNNRVLGDSTTSVSVITSAVIALIDEPRYLIELVRKLV